jgi:hypothetical protein
MYESCEESDLWVNCEFILDGRNSAAVDATCASTQTTHQIDRALFVPLRALTQKTCLHTICS